MHTYQLIVQFTAEALKEVREAGQKLTLVKGDREPGGTPVIWTASDPFVENVIEWTGIYGLYASKTEVLPGVTIVETATKYPAQPGDCYPFAKGAFGSPTGNADGNGYGIENHERRELTFGLVQSVAAAGRQHEANPVNAVPVLPNQKATFTPVERVQVFLQAEFGHGVISGVEGPALTVDFADKPHQTIHYDLAKGVFLRGPLSG